MKAELERKRKINKDMNWIDLAYVLSPEHVYQVNTSSSAITKMLTSRALIKREREIEREIMTLVCRELGVFLGGVKGSGKYD